MIDESFRNLITKHSQGQRELEKQVESLPYETSSFSIEALNKIILIKRDLKKATENLPIETALSAAIGYLDSHQWAARFTSGEIGKRNPDRDSLYYVTPEGASLRLKVSNKTGGLIRQVIQPFMEKIYFEDTQNNISFKPQIGLTPEEYASKEFFELQDSEDEVKASLASRIRVYRSEGSPVLIKNVPDGYSHTGSQINFLR